MASNKDTPQVWQHYGGDGGGYRVLRDMTASELAEREAGHQAYEDMLARQRAYERSRVPAPQKEELPIVGCVFAKSCKLPNAIINYFNPSGVIPTDVVKDYGDFALLGAREVDESGRVPLKRISGALPANIGSLALGGTVFASAEAASTGIGAAATGAGLATAGVVAGALVGLVALLTPSPLGDSALYTEDQLRSLKHARIRVRLRVEEQGDGTLKGYGYNTQSRRDWEMIPVVTFETRGAQQIADFGDGIELIWTPAADAAGALGIPALEAAPQAPHIWVFPPTPVADNIIVNPIYPPEYKDFILVFPAGSGVRPLYIVLNVPGAGYVPAPSTLPGFPDAARAKRKTSVQGGGGLRKRWKTASGLILEWDSQHGAVEMYDKRGRHLGEFDPDTGEQTKKADSTRSVEP